MGYKGFDDNDSIVGKQIFLMFTSDANLVNVYFNYLMFSLFNLEILL